MKQPRAIRTSKATIKGKPVLHPRNKHQGQYDFKALIQACPELKPFVQVSAHGQETINFSDATAVMYLNKALLSCHYHISNWDIPEGYLCPPVPGRAEYIHHLADLLGTCNKGIIPEGPEVTCLDIGVGANLIYPIIGHQTYGWSFIGSDIDKVALNAAQHIIRNNHTLTNHVQLRFQANPKHIFKGIIQPDEYVDLTICNPPFHASAKEAAQGSLRKLSNLTEKKVTRVHLNFGGQHHELWCEGGEAQFVQQMIHESKNYASSCLWFSTLIAKQANLNKVYAALKQVGAKNIKTIDISLGNKTSRVVAWSFLTPAQQKEWVSERWNKKARLNNEN